MNYNTNPKITERIDAGLYKAEKMLRNMQRRIDVCLSLILTKPDPQIKKLIRKEIATISKTMWSLLKLEFKMMILCIYILITKKRKRH